MVPAVSSRKLWGVIFIFACVFAVVAASLWTADPDVFWHLKVGGWIVRHGSVPKADIYSWSAAGRPWTCHEWLWEVIICLAYKRLGVVGLWLPVFIAGAGAGLLVYGAVGKGGETFMRAAIAGGAAPVMLVGWLLREVLAAAVVALLWANIHSSAVMFPFLLLAEALWRNFILREKTLPFWVASMLSGAATLINPHGTGLWIYAVKEGLLSHEYRMYIAEWMPYFFCSPELSASFFASAGIILAGAAQGRWRSVEFTRTCGFWVLALLSRIYTPYAVLSAALLLGRLDFQFRPKVLKMTAAAVLVFGAVVLVARGVPENLDAMAAKGKYPVKAVDYLLSHGQGKLFNDYGFGGYLIWKGIPVYIDGRADLYRYNNIFLSYVEAPQKWGGKLSQFIRKTGASAALVYRHGQFDRALEESSDWRRVYADDNAAVYEIAH